MQKHTWRRYSWLHITKNLQSFSKTATSFHRSTTRTVSCNVPGLSVGGWSSDSWCLYFFRRINWTLFSRLMCRRSLLDLNQLDSSPVKTTGAYRMEGAKEIGKESRTTGRLWKAVRKTTLNALLPELQRFEMEISKKMEIWRMLIHELWLNGRWQTKAHVGGLTDSSEEADVVNCFSSVQTSN